MSWFLSTICFLMLDVHVGGSIYSHHSHHLFWTIILMFETNFEKTVEEHDGTHFMIWFMWCFIILFWMISEIPWTSTVQEQVGPGTSQAPVISMCLWRRSWPSYTRRMQLWSSPPASWRMTPPSSLWLKCFQVNTDLWATGHILRFRWWCPAQTFTFHGAFTVVQGVRSTLMLGTMHQWFKVSETVEPSVSSSATMTADTWRSCCNVLTPRHPK